LVFQKPQINAVFMKLMLAGQASNFITDPVFLNADDAGFPSISLENVL
jgi:hypothetical protein